MKPHDLLAHAQLTAKRLVNMMFADLTSQQMLHRPCEGANCPAWILGHLVLSERRFLLAAGATPLPVPDDFEQKFARNEVAPKLTDYGDVTALLPLWNQLHDQLIAHVPTLSAEQLETKLDQPHPLFETLGQLLNFANHHATMHAGQVSVIRRSLGKPPVV